MLNAIKLRIRALLRKAEIEQELDEELLYHLERAVQQNIARGQTPEEARRDALVALGGIPQIKEASRDARGFRFIDDLWRDLRYAVRVLRKSPAFAIVTVLTIAIGIGVNTAVFTLSDLFFRPLPVNDPDALVQVDLGHRAFKMERLASFPEYVYLKQHTNFFSGLAAIRNDRMVLSADRGLGEPAHVFGQYVSDNFFSVLGSTTESETTLTMGNEEAAGVFPCVVLSYRLWHGQFGAIPDIVGRHVRLNGIPFTVAGVMPRKFAGFGLEEQDGERPGAFAPRPDPDIWVPLAMYPQLRRAGPEIFADSTDRWLTLYGRLRQGRTPGEAAAEITVLLSQIDRDRPDSARGRNRGVWAGDPDARPYLASPSLVQVNRLSVLGEFPSDAWPVILAVLGAAGIVLLIACSNLANLFFARAAARRREIGMRLGLGATRGRLVRQLLTEAFLLAGTGGIAGLALSSIALKVLLAARVVSLPGLPNLEDLALMNIAPDARVFAYTTALSLIACCAFGLAPALHATRCDLIQTLKNEGSMPVRRGKGLRLPGGLLVMQVALCLVLLVSAALLLRGIGRAQELEANAGLDTRNLLVVNADLASARFAGVQKRQFYDELENRLAAQAGVQSTAIAYNIPLANTNQVRTRIAMQGGDDSVRSLGFVRYNLVSRNFFDTVGIPIVHGRSFTPEELVRAANVLVVSESLAKTLWPGQEPVGKILQVGLYGSDRRQYGPAEVVGVARDARDTLTGLDRDFLYAPLSPDGFGSAVLVRTSVDAAVMEPVLRTAAKALDPDVLLTVNSLADRISHMDDIVYARSAFQLACVLGVLALLLAVLGLYGSTAYSVGRKTPEIGIRMACGANRFDVLRLIAGEGLRLVAPGIAIGIVAAMAVSRLLSGLIFGLNEIDLVAYVSVSILLALVATLALIIPALRGTRVDPMAAIRL